MLLFWVILSTILFIVTLPGSIELLLVTSGAFFSLFKKNKKNQENKFPQKIVVIIPAHNEEKGIHKTLTSIQSCQGSFSIVVVADNCTDHTADIVKKAGIRLLVRNDLTKKGKNYALQFAIETLMSEGYDKFIFLDADTTVETNFVQALTNIDAAIIQARYDLINPHESLQSSWTQLAFLAFNTVRPIGRQFWGFSSGILGNGFAVTKRILQDVPYKIDSIVEDLVYHLELVRKGYKVHFSDATTVTSEVFANEDGLKTQHARWEGGRLRALIDYTPILSKEIFLGNYKLIEPLLDLLLLPLSFHILFLFPLLFSPVLFFKMYSLLAYGLLLIHLTIAIKYGKISIMSFLSLLLTSPIYILWKILRIPQIIFSSKKGTEWKRTQRDNKE